MHTLFFKPADAVCADFIPFYEDGTFYLFYLKDYRDVPGHGEGTPWFLVTTKNFIHFQDRGEILPRGTAQEQDLYVFTGCVVKREGKYHIYYTGHNPHLRADGLPEQAVMHAVSDDLLHWDKCPQDTFFAPEPEYDRHDWRDPFVYWRGDKNRYEMLLAARGTQGASRRRGMTALCASSDGIHWTVEPPFWNPGLYFTHECPDLFQLGGWYYLVYSEFSQSVVTRYRMSRSLDGPWMAPADDQLDGRAFYAAKSCQGNGSRYLFGWIPTREGEAASGGFQWGGCLCVHELFQRADGTLGVRMPQTLADSFAPSCGPYAGTVEGTLGYAASPVGELPPSGMLRVSLRVQEGTHSMGIALRCDPQLENGYFVRLEPSWGKVVIDRWPRPGDLIHETGLERPLPRPSPSGEYQLELLVDDTAATLYLQGEIALGFRMYETGGASWGIFIQDGITEYEASLLTRPTAPPDHLGSEGTI